MTFLQALRYFAKEALVNMVRSWKVSLLAVATIATSLFLAGAFVLISGNLSEVVREWRGESKIVVYFAEGTDEVTQKTISGRAAEAGFVRAVELVDSETAQQRFATSFPSMAGLLEGWGDEPLPASLEIDIDWQAEGIDAWADTLREDPAVVMVDDDRDWLARLQTVILVLRGLGLIVGAILLLTAIFTIASVIRLTAYLYRDEIAVMRLVGATEFFIRGPFWAEGLFQGLLGGLSALLALAVGHTVVQRRYGDELIPSVLAESFLGPVEALALVALGGLAGFIGALVSLRRENLGQTGARREPKGGATAAE
ncbi:MAG: permease-like cell division protein FtsX [Acidobacteriota bacterium]